MSRRVDLDPGEGHHFELLGAHDAPTDVLIAQLTDMARAELPGSS